MSHEDVFILRRNESPDLLHERDIVGHRVPGLGKRHIISRINTHVSRFEAAGREATRADEAAGVESSVSETRYGCELHAAG